MVILFASIFGRDWTFLKSLSSLLYQGPQICQKFVPEGNYSYLYGVLVCGAKFPSGHAKQLFMDTGLMHLIVVSGSHLVFMEVLLKRFPKSIRLSTLAAYSYVTGFQPPVMRAFLRRGLRSALKPTMGLTSFQVEAVATAMALLFCPAWLTSTSFVMGWMCGLALCTPRLCRSRHFFASNLDLALKCYIFLLPLFWTSPLTIAWNTLFAPFVGLVLFPASLLLMLIPRLSPLTDSLWKAFLTLLEMGPQSAPESPSLMFFLPDGLLFLVPLFMHIVLMTAEVKWRRACAYS